MTQKGRGYPALRPRGNMPGYPYNSRMPKLIEPIGHFQNGAALEQIPLVTIVTGRFVPAAVVWQYPFSFSTFFGIYDCAVSGFCANSHIDDVWTIQIYIGEVAPAPFGVVIHEWDIHFPDDQPAVGTWLLRSPDRVFYNGPLGPPSSFFFVIRGY